MARSMRVAGEFDEHLAKKFEEEWGLQMPGWEDDDADDVADDDE